MSREERLGKQKALFISAGPTGTANLLIKM